MPAKWEHESDTVRLKDELTTDNLVFRRYYDRTGGWYGYPSEFWELNRITQKVRSLFSLARATSFLRSSGPSSQNSKRSLDKRKRRKATWWNGFL